MPMSDEHKTALAEGRKQARAIKAYLTALQNRKPGRPASKDGIEARLERVDAQLGESEDPLKAVELHQAKLDLEHELAAVGEVENLEELEKGFVAHANAYSERKGISYTAWRQIGVPAATLRAAGVKETRRRR